MCRRNHARFAAAEFVELRRDDIAVHTLGLVDDEMQRSAAAAQLFCDHLVLRGQPVAAVDDKQQRIGLGNRGFGLARHLMNDALLRLRLEATGIDDEEGTFAQPAVAIVAVTREAWLVGDQRGAGLRQAVEQR